MKIKVIVLLVVFLLVGGHLYAATGDLTVNGILNVGAGGVKYPDGSIQQTAQLPTTQKDVTTSRSFGTVFRNTTGKPMFVSASFTVYSGVTAIAYTDSANPPVTEVSRFGIVGATPGVSLFFVVLPGNYYKVSHGWTLLKWFEWY